MKALTDTLLKMLDENEMNTEDLVKRAKLDKRVKDKIIIHSEELTIGELASIAVELGYEFNFKFVSLK